ncbi:MAG: D-alanyl-D-alanine carboxypeptidase/D-alanyl-D-alanine-endopeptidase [Deltaproteobacteria bacterium]|nr:D-alanyl-D-alanine carboxypeptidase/D-alanyl-D-alanine-endopeptidase [Deltaproteobacteria bacterium]
MASSGTYLRSPNPRLPRSSQPLRALLVLLLVLAAAPSLAKGKGHRPQPAVRPPAVRPSASAVAPAVAQRPPPADDSAQEEVESPQAAEQHTANRGEDLQAIWRSAPGKMTAVGLIVDLSSGQVVFEAAPHKQVYPASVAKLFTTAAFVRTADLDAKPVTEVRASAKSGEVELAVIGVGDPSMTAAEWGKLADAVKASGVTRVKKLGVDATVFDDKLPKGFDEKNTDAAFRAPVGGLSVDASTLQVVVKPGEVGNPPLVTVTPDAGEAVVVVNHATTVAKGKSSLNVVTRPNGKKTEVVVTGSLPAKAKAVGTGRRRVADSAYHAGWVFRQLLEQKGIAVAGAPVFGKSALTGPVVAQHVHHDWRAIAAVTNKQSHNGYAETLFKQVGLLQGGAPATGEKAAEGLKKALGGLEIRWDSVKIGNGSGLYHADTVTAQAVIDLLRAMAKDKKGKDWKATLAVGGVDGTLRGRLKGKDTQGKVFAKTGTLDDVSGLAGYAERGEKVYAFAFFFNGIRGAGPYRGVQDRMLRRLLAE